MVRARPSQSAAARFRRGRHFSTRGGSCVTRTGQAAQLPAGWHRFGEKSLHRSRSLRFWQHCGNAPGPRVARCGPADAGGLAGRARARLSDRLPGGEHPVAGLVATGHGYMSVLPIVLGVAAAVVVLSLAATALDAARGRRVRTVPAVGVRLLARRRVRLPGVHRALARLGLFPVVRRRAAHVSPRHPLQLPFGALAYFAARLLLRTAKRLGRRLARVWPPRVRPRRARCSFPAAQPLPPLSSPLSRSLGRRGPPLSLQLS